jgi:FPC/CPF motif-containing protein YcgG
MPTQTPLPELARRLEDFIRDPDFCCVGAKSALAKGQLHIHVARDIRSAWDDLAIHAQLVSLAQRFTSKPTLYQSFAVVFEQPRMLTEAAFEEVVWQRIQSLADKDAWRGHENDSTVDADPTSPHFSLSFGGQAFFVVGLHPRASRAARRFEAPAMVFNLHAQFEMLREQGRYEKLRRSILDRDFQLTGSANPMLARHGETSEARQYSGRVVANDWRCPFQPAHRDPDAS